MRDNDLTNVLLFCLLMVVICFGLADATIARQTKVVHVHGHTCVETKGFARSISCDWGK